MAHSCCPAHLAVIAFKLATSWEVVSIPLAMSSRRSSSSVSFCSTGSSKAEGAASSSVGRDSYDKIAETIYNILVETVCGAFSVKKTMSHMGHIYLDENIVPDDRIECS